MKAYWTLDGIDQFTRVVADTALEDDFNVLDILNFLAQVDLDDLCDRLHRGIPVLFAWRCESPQAE